MHHVSSYTIELFGVPRLLANKSGVNVHGETLAEIAAALLAAAPVLGGRVLDPHTGWPLDGYVLVVDAAFTRDPLHPISAESTIFLVASAAGG